MEVSCCLADCVIREPEKILLTSDRLYVYEEMPDPFST